MGRGEGGKEGRYSFNARARARRVGTCIDAETAKISQNPRWKRGVSKKRTSAREPQHIHDLLHIRAHLVHALVALDDVGRVRDGVLLDPAPRDVHHPLRDVVARIVLLPGARQQRLGARPGQARGGAARRRARCRRWQRRPNGEAPCCCCWCGGIAAALTAGRGSVCCGHCVGEGRPVSRCMRLWS